MAGDILVAVAVAEVAASVKLAARAGRFTGQGIFTGLALFSRKSVVDFL